METSTPAIWSVVAETEPRLGELRSGHAIEAPAQQGLCTMSGDSNKATMSQAPASSIKVTNAVLVLKRSWDAQAAVALNRNGIKFKADGNFDGAVACHRDPADDARLRQDRAGAFSAAGQGVGWSSGLRSEEGLATSIRVLQEGLSAGRAAGCSRGTSRAAQNMVRNCYG